jgi:hypothetical protein
MSVVIDSIKKKHEDALAIFERVARRLSDEQRHTDTGNIREGVKRCRRAFAELLASRESLLGSAAKIVERERADR